MPRPKRTDRPRLRVVRPPMTEAERRKLTECLELAEDAAFLWLKITHDRLGDDQFLSDARDHLTRGASWVFAACGEREAMKALSIARKAVKMTAANAGRKRPRTIRNRRRASIGAAAPALTGPAPVNLCT